jgi:hypothetical protein
MTCEKTAFQLDWERGTIRWPQSIEVLFPSHGLRGASAGGVAPAAGNAIGASIAARWRWSIVSCVLVIGKGLMPVTCGGRLSCTTCTYSHVCQMPKLPDYVTGALGSSAG